MALNANMTCFHVVDETNILESLPGDRIEGIIPHAYHEHHKILHPIIPNALPQVVDNLPCSNSKQHVVVKSLGCMSCI